MTNAKGKTLGAVISISKGRKHEILESPSSTARRLIGIDDLRNDDLIRYTEDATGTEANVNDVLIAWDGANAGTIGYGKDGYIGSTIARLRLKPGARHFTPFLGMYLKSKFGYLRRTATGATIPHINRKSLESIPLPPLEFSDQVRIAELLGRVEELIARRTRDVEYLDDLLRSVFLTMFGDPTQNEKGWIKAPLNELGSINRGVSKHRPRNDPQLLGGSYPLIQTGEVSNAGTYITTYTQTYSDIGFAQSKLWPVGTLCITIAANIAQTGILTFDACFPDSVVGFIANDLEANTIYVLGLFWFFQAILEKNAPAAAQKNINLEILRDLEVPKPPLDLQNKFADMVVKIESLKARYQQGFLDLQVLHAALSQKAFKGQLDLSRMEAPAQHIVQRAAADELIVAAPYIQELPVIILPELGLPSEELGRAGGLQALLAPWLAAYQDQLRDASFSVERFMSIAQARLQELYPDAELELRSAASYEEVKRWVFAALDDGRLAQAFDEESKVIQLKAGRA
jgi:type I restriction enzyme S subunit